jgi:uncharacterized RmlC-like cupin family protein
MRGGYTYGHRPWGGIYEVRVQIGSGAMIYIPSFIKTGSAIRKLIKGDTQTHGMVIG